MYIQLAWGTFSVYNNKLYVFELNLWVDPFSKLSYSGTYIS